MEGTLNTSIRPTASGPGGAPRPRGGLTGSGLQLKRKLGVGAKEEEVQRKRKCVQPGSRLVSQRAM